MLYGFPLINGPLEGIKIATEQYEDTVDPDAVSRTISDADITAMYRESIAPRFPDVSGQCLRMSSCLYTVTPDAKFVVDHLRDCENIFFASACSGHGFKHSAALGEALALWALQRPSAIDLSPFRMERFPH
jgi:sarcosine oxidase